MVAIHLETSLATVGDLKNHPTAIVKPPNEILGEFLTAELDNLKVRESFILELISITEAAMNDESIKWEDGLGGHAIVIANGKAVIEAPYRDEGDSCTMDCSDVHRVLCDWYEFLKSVQ